MPFFEPVWYNLVNWPHAHCGVLQLTEVSSLGPDSPRTSPRNETVKQCRRQRTVVNSPVQWPSWTWCRTWWNLIWHSSRVTFKSALFCLHSSAHSSGVWISCHFANSEPQRCFWLLPIGMQGPCVVVWQLNDFCIGRIEYGPDGRHRLTQKQSLDSGI